jgi:hypothetical protein
MPLLTHRQRKRGYILDTRVHRLSRVRPMPSKRIPRRRSKIAEDYAKKVRMEPPKATRQETPLAAEGKITARQHNPAKKPSRRRSPF